MTTESIQHASASQGKAEDTAASDDTGDGSTLIPLRLKITHCGCNVPSLEHLTETHEVMVKRDGSDTAADVKRALSLKANIPAHELRLMWFDNVIGRFHRGDPLNVDDDDTLAKFNVTRWVEKFPHWCATLGLLEAPPRDALESIHTAVAVHKGIRDVDAYVDSKRGTPEWSQLQN
jgi:hypothetical protein